MASFRTQDELDDRDSIIATAETEHMTAEDKMQRLTSGTADYEHWRGVAAGWRIIVDLMDDADLTLQQLLDALERAKGERHDEGYVRAIGDGIDMVRDTMSELSARSRGEVPHGGQRGRKQ